MRCPHCTPEEQDLSIICFPRTKVYVDSEGDVIDSDQEEGYTWDESSDAECRTCDWYGTVGDLNAEEDKEPVEG